MKNSISSITGLPIKTNVIQTEGTEAPRGILAEAIMGISKAFDQLLSSGINERAIIALVRDRTGMRKGDIQAVLDTLQSLRADYCR